MVTHDSSDEINQSVYVALFVEKQATFINSSYVTTGYMLQPRQNRTFDHERIAMWAHPRYFIREPVCSTRMIYYYSSYLGGTQSLYQTPMQHTLAIPHWVVGLNVEWYDVEQSRGIRCDNDYVKFDRLALPGSIRCWSWRRWSAGGEDHRGGYLIGSMSKRRWTHRRTVIVKRTIALAQWKHSEDVTGVNGKIS